MPLVAVADVATTYDVNALPTTGLGSNAVVDVSGHDLDSSSVWLATGKGVSFTYDKGLTWLTYGTENGLPSGNVSAVASVSGRLWVGTAHSEYIAGELMTISDGVTYSDDNGMTWNQVNFGSDGLDIEYVWGGDRSVYDITGFHDEAFFDHEVISRDADWLFFTAFAGGLLASLDNGEHWRRIFPSPADSIQFALTDEAPSLRNRYFACAVDSSHGDSLYLWTGSAGGVFQYVYVPPRHKLFSRQINGVAYCDTCSTDRGSRLYLAGDNGVSLGTAQPGPFETRFVRDGLPGKTVTAIISLGEYLVVGTADTTAGVSTGLAISTDGGQTYMPLVQSELEGSNRQITGFLHAFDRLYLSAEQAGLWVSEDSGQSWSGILIDSADTNSALNHVNAVDVLDDTLLVATDSGLIELEFTPDGTITDTRHRAFADSDTSGARIVKVKPQFFLDTLGVLDSTVLWTVHRAATTAGVSMVGRRGWEHDVVAADTTIDSFVTPWDTTIDTLSMDSAHYWSKYQIGRTTFDVNFFGDTAFVVGDSGIFFTTRGFDPSNRFSVRQFSNDTTVVATMDNDVITFMDVRSDTVVFGSINGFALSNDRGQRFVIYRPNLDTLSAEFAINHNTISSILGLTGDFIPALAVQYTDSTPARIWVSGRPVEIGYPGVSCGEYRTITNVDGDSVGYDLVWQAVLEGQFAWNLAFVNDSVFAATNDGLLLHAGARDDTGYFVTEWDTVAFKDEVSGEQLIEPGTAVFGCEVVDSFLWVGTNDGTVRISLDGSGRQQLHQKVDSTTSPDDVYAFPVPFSSIRGDEVDFHFIVEEPGYVTLEVYDFAMNLVARPIDNVWYDAGIYPDGSSQGRTWDGYNGNGDRAAVGVYYFKVEVGGGDTRWGKLAIIP